MVPVLRRSPTILAIKMRWWNRETRRAFTPEAEGSSPFRITRGPVVQRQHARFSAWEPGFNSPQDY